VLRHREMTLLIGKTRDRFVGTGTNSEPRTRFPDQVARDRAIDDAGHVAVTSVSTKRAIILFIRNVKPLATLMPRL